MSFIPTSASGSDETIEIRTIRPAKDDEIALMRWHDEMVAREAEWRSEQQGD